MLVKQKFINKVIFITSIVSGIPVPVILSKDFKHEARDARAVVCKELSYAGFTYEQIGEVLSFRNQSTICKYVKRYHDRCNQPDFKTITSRIEWILNIKNDHQS